MTPLEGPCLVQEESVASLEFLRLSGFEVFGLVFQGLGFRNLSRSETLNEGRGVSCFLLRCRAMYLIPSSLSGLW